MDFAVFKYFCPLRVYIYVTWLSDTSIIRTVYPRLTLDLKDENYRNCVLPFPGKPVKAITVVIYIMKYRELSSKLNVEY